MSGMVNFIKKFWVPSVILLGAGGLVADDLITPDPVPLQVIEWAKPKTDAEWAEDVKKENFDIKSTGVLEKMKTAHEEKLLKVLDGKDEELNCEQCLRFKIKKQHPEMSQQEQDQKYIDAAEFYSDRNKLMLESSLSTGVA